MGYFRERLKHAVRFRHKRGYGVHSPFVFRLIAEAICDRSKRYTYPLPAEQFSGIRLRERKLCRLACRLCSWLELRTALCLAGGAEELALYLSGNPDLREVQVDMPGVAEQAAFIYVGRETPDIGEGPVWIDWNTIQPWKGERRCIVVTDIYRNGRNSRLWRLLKERATVRVDMMWYGILLFDEKLQQGNYYLTI